MYELRDLNFFTPYIEKKKSKNTPQLVLYTMAFILLLSMVGLYGRNWVVMNRMNVQIKLMVSEMSEEKNLQKIKKYEETKQKLDTLKAYYQTISKLNNAMARDSVISSKLLMELNSALPQNTFLQSMNLDKSNLQLQGVSSSRPAIAEYQYNLKQLGLFDEVSVTNINVEQADTGNFIFSMKCVIKDGDNDEVK